MTPPHVAEPRARNPVAARATGSRPILLATLAVPFAPEASALAVDTAVEAGAPLLVANVVVLPPLGMSVNMGYDQIDETPEDARALRAPAELAHALGVAVERVRVRSPRPVAALLELTAEREPALLVFGPDPSRLRAGRYARAARAVRAGAPCLVWTPA
ncbi:MAG: universal stress protein [Thermoleophilia bacterium]|nr:universal stress protein [Thermoleophilia bacterium]